MNRLALCAAAALASLAMSGAAFADGQVRATLEAPVDGHVKLIAAHAVFNCEASTCVAAVAPEDASDAFACRDLARQVGRIAAYAEWKSLDDKQLAKCNVVAKPPKTIGTASR